MSINWAAIVPYSAVAVPERGDSLGNVDYSNSLYTLKFTKQENKENAMTSGSCLCGAVTYTISGNIGDIVHCHCQTCRKAHGSAFSSVASVQDNSFNLLSSEKLKSYESSTGKYRFFCSDCGSQIYAKRENTSHIILRLGSLDSNINSTEKEHIWTSEKASWYCINSLLPERKKFE